MVTNIIYKNLDPLPPKTSIIELFYQGKCLVDLHNQCEIKNVEFRDSKLIILFELVYENRPRSEYLLGTEFELTFLDAKLISLSTTGGLTDLGTLDEIFVLNEDVKNNQLELIINIGEIEFVIKVRGVSLNIRPATYKEKATKKAGSFFAKFKKFFT